jgi:hypothetical protein
MATVAICPLFRARGLRTPTQCQMHTALLLHPHRRCPPPPRRCPHPSLTSGTSSDHSYCVVWSCPTFPALPFFSLFFPVQVCQCLPGFHCIIDSIRVRTANTSILRISCDFQCMAPRPALRIFALPKYVDQNRIRGVSGLYVICARLLIVIARFELAFSSVQQNKITRH